jgi:hypothetical protein
MDDQRASLIYGPHLQTNLSTVFSIKFFVSVFAGATAGVLGFTNLSGFLLFALSTLFSAALVVLLKCGRSPAKYVGEGSTGFLHLLSPGMDNIFGFILTWTLFYGMSSDLLYPQAVTDPAARYHPRSVAARFPIILKN